MGRGALVHEPASCRRPRSMPDEHRPKGPVLLAVDQGIGEAAASGDQVTLVAVPEANPDTLVTSFVGSYPKIVQSMVRRTSTPIPAEEGAHGVDQRLDSKRFRGAMASVVAGYRRGPWIRQDAACPGVVSPLPRCPCLSISSVTSNDRSGRGRQAQRSSRRRHVHRVSAPSF
jgi:hypothetical protein